MKDGIGPEAAGQRVRFKRPAMQRLRSLQPNAFADRLCDNTGRSIVFDDRRLMRHSARRRMSYESANGIYVHDDVTLTVGIWLVVTYVAPMVILDVREYLGEDGTSPFADWFAALGDAAAVKITVVHARI